MSTTAGWSGAQSARQPDTTPDQIPALRAALARGEVPRLDALTPLVEAALARRTTPPVGLAELLREVRAAEVRGLQAIIDGARDEDGQERSLLRSEQAQFDAAEARVRQLDRLDDQLTEVRELAARVPASQMYTHEAEVARQVRAEHGLLGAAAPLPPALQRQVVERLRSSQGPGRGARSSTTLPTLRDLVGGSGAGQYLAPEQWAGLVWDRLAAQAILLQLGPTVIPTERDTLHVPRVVADGAAQFVREAIDSIPLGNPDVNEIIATPRKLGAMRSLSRELVNDSSPSATEFLLGEIARAIALALDLHAFEGDGVAPRIRGLRNVAGISEVSMGTDGAVPTNLDPFADAIAALEGANAKPTAFVMHPRTWKTVSKLKVATGNIQPVIFGANASPTGTITRALYGVPVYLSSQLSVTETQGTSEDCSSAYCVQGDQLVLVRRQDLLIESDGGRQRFDLDVVQFRGTMRLDFVVPNPAAVCRIKGIRA